MADNGPMHELAPMGPHEAIFRGGKGDYMEGGIRVPAFAWWPGTIAPNQTVGDIVAVHDLFTTFASLGGGMSQIPVDRVIDGVDQTALMLNGDGHSRRDYYHVYTGDVLAASIKQQLKRVWLGDRPGLVGEAFHDLYKDTREEHGEMAPFIWAWAPFDHMRTRHEALIEEYPHHTPTHGTPYQGLEGTARGGGAVGPYGPGSVSGRYMVVGAQIDLLVFDAPPEALDEDVVAPCALAVHTDLDVGVLQRLDEVDGRELPSLVRIHDLRLAGPTDGLVESVQAWRGFQRHRQPPGQHLSAEPVQNGDQANEPSGHGDVGNVHRPDLIGPFPRQYLRRKTLAFDEIRMRLPARLGDWL